MMNTLSETCYFIVNVTVSCTFALNFDVEVTFSYFNNVRVEIWSNNHACTDAVLKYYLIYSITSTKY